MRSREESPLSGRDNAHTADFGLMFYKARWYDSSLGRFAQADSIVPAGVQGYDRYAYGLNNPSRYTDPSGHCAIDGDDWCYDKPSFSDWNSDQYGGCFKCHAATANGQIALTDEQLAEAYSNITTWQAIGYTPIVGTAAVLGAPALGPSMYNVAGVTCLRERFLSQYVANFNMRRMLAI